MSGKALWKSCDNFQLVAVCHDPRGGLFTLLDLEAAVVEAEAVRTATEEARKDLLLGSLGTKKELEKSISPKQKKTWKNPKIRGFTIGEKIENDRLSQSGSLAGHCFHCCHT